jgi:hypothetical protein
MNVDPILFLQHLTDEEIAKHECSDRIWLPRGQFEYWLGQMEPGVLNVLRLTNAVGQTVVGSPYAMHHNGTISDSTIYIPEWMLARLNGDYNRISVERVSPNLCTKLTVQPYTSEHLQSDDPLEALRDAFECYSCIQSYISIPLWIHDQNTQVRIDISSTEPSSHEPLCIRNGTIDLELLRPLDYDSPPPSPVLRPGTPIPPPLPEMIPLPLISNVVAEQQAQPLSREEMRARALNAALARINKPPSTTN